MYICWYINCLLYVFFNIKYEYNITLTNSNYGINDKARRYESYKNQTVVHAIPICIPDCGTRYPHLYSWLIDTRWLHLTQDQNKSISHVNPYCVIVNRIMLQIYTKDNSSSYLIIYLRPLSSVQNKLRFIFHEP